MREQRRHRDEGFSLIEVIIAMVMIGIVASSALWFFINGMRTSSNLGRQQTAVSVATSAMEQTFAVSPKVDASAGVSGLVVGRSNAAVTSALSAVAGLGISGVPNSYPLSDPAGGTPVIPITTTVTRAGIDYTVYTLVGSCYRTVNASGAAQNCDKYSGYTGTAEPPATPGSTARMLRVIVSVTWAPRGDECATTLPTTLCHYDVSTLVDPSFDLVWNRVFDPEAVDDSWAFNPGDGKLTLVVLANDALGSVPVNPVKILTNNLPANAGTLVGPSSTGTFDYTPPVAGSWVSGIFTFTYQIHDIPGKTSQATASIWLYPKSADDVATATVGVAQVLNIYANDLGSPKTVTVTSGPSNGSLSYSGTYGATVTYKATAVGNDQFTYYYTDASGQKSPPATVKISVQAFSAADFTQVVNYRPSAAATAWVDISNSLRGPGGAGTTITVLGLPTAADTKVTAGELLIDGKAYAGGAVTGNKVEFQPAPGAAGEWTFPYQLTLGTYTSPQVKATMRVVVSAVSDSGVSFQKNLGCGKKQQQCTDNGIRIISAGSNDITPTWGTGTGVTSVTQGAISTNCGTWSGTPDLTNGQLSIIAPGSSISNCTATYTLTASGSTSTATINYNVTN